MGEVSASKSAVEEAANAISWVQQITGLPSIAESPFVRATLSKVRKEPNTADMLSAIVGSFGPVPTLTDIRLGAMALLSFAAFLRYDEVAKLQCCDIKFTHECMSAVIRSSKTDQYQQGDVVPVARTGTTNHATTNRTPSSLFLQRPMRTLLSLLQLNTERKVLNKQADQANRHDVHLKMRSFTVNQKVMVRNYRPGPKWITATIIRQLGPLSFMVKVKNGLEWKRHMEQIQGYLPTSEDISCSSSASTDDQSMTIWT